MNAELLSNIIRACALLLAAVILVIGLILKKRLVQYVAGALIVIVIIAYFVESEELRDILVAFTIIAAAILSAFSINETRKLRVESNQQRILNEISQ